MTSIPAYLVTIVIGIICFIIIQLLTSRKPQNTNNGKDVCEGGKEVPAVEGGLPFLGHAIAFGANPYEFLMKCVQKHGVPFKINLVGIPAVFVDASFRSEFFFMKNENFLNFNEAVATTLVPELTFGMSAITKPINTLLIKKQFSPQILPTYLTQLRDVLLNEIENNCLKQLSNVGMSMQVDNLEELAWRCIAICSCRSFFGPRAVTLPEMVDVFLNFNKHCFNVINAAMILPRFALNFLTGGIVADKNVVLKFIREEIEIRAGKEADFADNFLTHMLKLSDSDTGKTVTVEEVAERSLQLIFSSMVTSAGVLTHALCDLAELAQKPWSDDENITVWDKLKEEQRSVLEKHKGVLNYDALIDMTHLTSFLRESIRKSGAAIQQSRRAKEDGVLCGYKIEKGSMVFMNGFLSHNDKYFEKFDQFIPSRFLNADATDPGGSDSNGLFPFGIGRHMCPGRHFAFAEIKMSMIVLMEKFKFEVKPGEKFEYVWKPASCDRQMIPLTIQRVNK